MSAITHHIPDAMLAAYGCRGICRMHLPLSSQAMFRCVSKCRATFEAHQSVGGAVIEAAGPVQLSSTLKDDVLARLDTPFAPRPVYSRSGVFPGPVMQALKGNPPRWKSLGMGVRQDILSANGPGVGSSALHSAGQRCAGPRT